MKTATKPKVGDRVIYLGRVKGTLIKISKGLIKYEILWDGGRAEGYTQREWNRQDFELCSSSTSVAGSAQAFLSLGCNSDSPSVDSVKSMSTANQYSSSDIPTPQSTTTLEGLQLVIPAPEFASLPALPLANPSQSKGSAKEPTMSAIVYPLCVKRSPQSNPNSSVSKTYPDYSVAPTPQESQDPISTGFYKKFPSSGTMRNGSLYPADTLAAPGADKDCFWLESPGALSSSSSRSPGQSRLEAQLKKLGVLKKGECLDPKWLEKQFNLPANWTDPSESRLATQLLGQDGQHSVMPLIQKSQPLLLEESSISTQSQVEEKILGELHSEITHKSPRKRSPNLKPASGSLSACTTIKKGKPYVSYQYSYDVRDPDSKRGWRTVKVGVPRRKRQAIANLINQGMPVAEILAALKK